MAEPVAPAERVLIALDTGSSGSRVFEMGAGLAAALGATLEGLFVEDAGLLRLSGLPFAREISEVTGAWRGLVPEEIERALRLEAARLERLLAHAAENARVPWSFATARGRLLPQAVAREADLTIVGAARRAAATMGSASAQARARVPAGSFAVFFDASPPSFRALEVAERLAAALERQLRILVPSGAESAASAWTQARSRLATAGRGGVAMQLGAGGDALDSALRASGSELLVHALPDVAQSLEALAALVANLSCPLLVVRGAPGWPSDRRGAGAPPH